MTYLPGICLLMAISCTNVIAQNVGIGTNAPVKLLSVNGSLMVDQSNFNYGTIDSAGLRFGTNSLVGISSNRAVPANGNPDGLDFWTAGLRRMVITSSGRVGIGTIYPDYPLHVNGTAQISYLFSNGIYSTATIYTEYDLNADDDLYVGDDATLMGNVGIGAASSNSYKLRVEGNGLFTTNVGIDGTLRVDGKVTNDGRGIVKSNTSTTLRAGFSSGSFSAAFNAGQSYNIKFCITKFTGDNDNIRVMPAQFIPGSGNANAGCLVFIPTATAQTDADCGGGSSANIRVTNTCSSSANSGSSATLYLFSVVTD